MNQDFAQRRRVAVALAITVIAVPAAFLLNRNGDAASAPEVTLVGTVSLNESGSDGRAAGAPEPADAPAATDAMGSTGVGFLDGTVPARNNDPATIAIPRVGEAIIGLASFNYYIVDVTACAAKDAPFNVRLTVTNLDNSRSVTCINKIGGAQMKDDIVLHADAFLQIGDLTDAPIHVSITW
jgi:hypothetical protein